MRRVSTALARLVFSRSLPRPMCRSPSTTGMARRARSRASCSSTALSARGCCALYSKIKDQTVQRQLVSLMESIAANED